MRKVNNVPSPKSNILIRVVSANKPISVTEENEGYSQLVNDPTINGNGESEITRL